MPHKEKEDKAHEHLTPHPIGQFQTPIGDAEQLAAALQNLPQGAPGTGPLSLGQNGTAQEGGGGGILGSILGFLKDPRLLKGVGAFGAGFTGQGQEFLNRLQRDRQAKSERETAELKERRDERNRERQEAHREFGRDISTGTLEARIAEEKGRDARAQAKARQDELKAEIADKKAIIGIKINNNQAVTENEFVSAYGPSAAGFSITPKLGEDLIGLNIPENRQDIQKAIGGPVLTTTPDGVIRALEFILGQEDDPVPKIFHHGGVFLEQQPDGELVEVYRIEEEVAVKPKRPFPVSEQNATREALKAMIDGWGELSLRAQQAMINAHREVSENGDAPQPITSQVSRGLWSFMFGLLFNPLDAAMGTFPSSTVPEVTGVEALGTAPFPGMSVEDEIENFLQGR